MTWTEHTELRRYDDDGKNRTRFGDNDVAKNVTDI